MSGDKMKAAYKEMAYDYDRMAEDLGYPDPEWVANCLMNICKLPKDAWIHDFGCGSGLVGHFMKPHGYRNMDGSDASPEMLIEARKKGVYGDCRELFLTEQPMPKEWIGKYDAAVSAGLLTYDHCGPKAFDEKLAALRPGGLGWIVFTTREQYMSAVGFQQKLDELVRRKKIKFVAKIVFTRYDKVDPSKAAEERNKPTEVGCYVYRAIWDDKARL